MNLKICNFFAVGALIVFFSNGCAKPPVVLQTAYRLDNAPIAPNYNNQNYWAALPTKPDAADGIPVGSNAKNQQDSAAADLFFVHPTIYTYQPDSNAYQWNGDVNDATLNQRVDYSTILNQATAFNGSCRIYAPRYRQAHYYSFVTKNQTDRQQALDLAYADVKAAFEHYLKNYNQGRPIVIASHSQGTYHAKRLLKEFFDGKPLQQKLIIAYLVGDITDVPAQFNEFENIKPAQKPDETGGFVSWHTYGRGFLPDKYVVNRFQTAVCVNPLTWRLDEEYAPKQLNKGGIGLKFKFVPQIVDAQVHQGVLWINKPYIRGRAFVKNKSWHVADINFFWQNIRENVALRVETYLKTNGK